MNRPANSRRPTRRASGRRPSKAPDPWLVAAPLPELEPAPAPSEPTALLRSLGEPSLPDGERLAASFAAAVERAAAIATALALSAELPAAAAAPDADGAPADG